MCVLLDICIYLFLFLFCTCYSGFGFFSDIDFHFLQRINISLILYLMPINEYFCKIFKKNCIAWGLKKILVGLKGIAWSIKKEIIGQPTYSNIALFIGPATITSGGHPPQLHTECKPYGVHKGTSCYSKTTINAIENPNVQF